MVFAILMYIIPLVFVSVLLYWLIRLGVKHGMRSYAAESANQPSTEE